MTSSTREILDLVSDESSGAEEDIHRDNSLPASTTSPAPCASSRPRSRSPAYHEMNEEEGERKEAVQPTRKRRREQERQQQNGDPLHHLMEQHALDLIAIEDDDEQQDSSMQTTMEEGEIPGSTHTTPKSALVAATSRARRSTRSTSRRQEIAVSSDSDMSSSAVALDDDEEEEEGEVSEVNDADDSIDGLSDSRLSALERSFLTGLHGDATSTPRPQKKKPVVSRYFAPDPVELSIKCFNCGRGGHRSADCDAARVYAPCFICGHRHSNAWTCPRELCYKCGEEGHQARECISPRFTPVVCYRCGSTSHTFSSCMTPPSSGYWDLSGVHCFVCGKAGHINCAPPSFAHTPIQCCNCASPYHTYTTCTKAKMIRDVPLSESVYNNPATRGGNRTNDNDLCFECGEPGHQRWECPYRTYETWRQTVRVRYGPPPPPTSHRSLTSRASPTRHTSHHHHHHIRSDKRSTSTRRDRDRDRDRDRRR